MKDIYHFPKFRFWSAGRHKQRKVLVMTLQELQNALYIRSLDDCIKHQLRVRSGKVFSNFVGVGLMEQMFMPETPEGFGFGESERGR
mgnify:CR=1 FL=1